MRWLLALRHLGEILSIVRDLVAWDIATRQEDDNLWEDLDAVVTRARDVLRKVGG